MKKAKNILVLLLAAVLLISALPLTASAETVTRIDEFRFAANPNAISLRSNETVGVWLNNLKNANNGNGKGFMAAADAEGWKVNSVAGIYDGTEGRMLKNSDYPDLSHDNWLRVEVALTDPDNYVFNGNRNHTFTTYVNGLHSGGCPLNVYGQIYIRLRNYATIATAAFNVPKPTIGDQCSKYVPTVGDMPFSQASRIQITNYYWATFAPYSNWPNECTAFTDPDADYAIIVEFTTDDGYHFSSAGTVTVNGEEVEFGQYGDGTGKTITGVTYHVKFDSGSYLVGDVNGDGKVNGADAGVLSRYTSGWDGYADKIKNMDAADINRDGKVNGADSGILARYTSGWSGYDKYFVPKAPVG